MKLNALTENLATVRAELRTTHGKLTNLENIKTEKAGLFIRIDFLYNTNLIFFHIRY
jgi:hypothetical protein